MNPTKQDEPKTDTIPRTVKKSFINWLVPALCAALIFAIFTVAKSWADDRYTKRMEYDASQSAQNHQMDDESNKREALANQVEQVNRKLDLIVYILQHDPKIDSKNMPPQLNSTP